MLTRSTSKLWTGLAAAFAAALPMIPTTEATALTYRCPPRYQFSSSAHLILDRFKLVPQAGGTGKVICLYGTPAVSIVLETYEPLATCARLRDGLVCPGRVPDATLGPMKVNFHTKINLDEALRNGDRELDIGFIIGTVCRPLPDPDQGSNCGVPGPISLHMIPGTVSGNSARRIGAYIPSQDEREKVGGRVTAEFCLRRGRDPDGPLGVVVDANTFHSNLIFERVEFPKLGWQVFQICIWTTHGDLAIVRLRPPRRMLVGSSGFKTDMQVDLFRLTE